MVDTLNHVVDTLSTYIANDTLRVAIDDMPQGKVNILDTTYKLAMIAIGACNLIFTFFLFYHNNKRAKKKLMQNTRRQYCMILYLTTRWILSTTPLPA